jgi:hypothetical protein
MPRFQLQSIAATVMLLSAGSLRAQWQQYHAYAWAGYGYGADSQISEQGDSGPLEDPNRAFAVVESRGAPAMNGRAEVLHQPRTGFLPERPVLLKASASVQWDNGFDHEQYFAGAYAVWNDRLVINNADLVGNVPYLYFLPDWVGEHYGDSSAHFTVTIGSEDTWSSNFSFDDGPGEETAIAPPIKKYYGPDLEQDGLSLVMELRVAAGGPAQAGEGSVDFSHTAELGPILIGDVNGNPIPGWENVQIVGDSGRTYDVEAALPGDYNTDGVVDGADYVVWRKNVGRTGLRNEGVATSPGIVDLADYNLWRSQFGRTAFTAGGFAAHANVPEPVTIDLAVAGLAGVFAIARRR